MAKELTEKQRIEALKIEERNRVAFAANKDALQLIDLTKNKNLTYNTYSKDKLRTMLKNPTTESNQQNLRKLSTFLYTVSHVYRRLVNFKALQTPLKNWMAYPTVSIVENIDTNNVLFNYERVCNYVKNMDMKSQSVKIFLSMWLWDLFIGYTYGNPENNEDGFFIHSLPLDYCKICAQDYYSGVLHIAFNFSFFDGTNEFYLDVYDPIFKKMYNKYKSDSNLKWQELPIERTVAFKVNIENLDYPIPPMASLFNSLVDLCDLQEVQNVKDNLEAYKLIYAKIDTLSGARNPDEFEIDLELATNFFNKIQGAVPENVAIALSPMKLESIDFKSNTADDTNILSDAYENLINTFGGIVLNHNRIQGSTAFKLALMNDTMDATALVEQVNAWVNLYILNNIGDTNITVEFNATSPFFIQDRIDQLLKVAQYSIPAKMELASLVIDNPIKERGCS